MGYTSLILAMIGGCICWLPHLGWLGIALGLAGGGFGIFAVTMKAPPPTVTLLGISGNVMGWATVSLGLAYQIKHAAGTLDSLYVPIDPTVLLIAICGCAALWSGSLYVSRRIKTAGRLVAFVAFVAASLAGGWRLTAAELELKNASRSAAAAIAPQVEKSGPR